MYKSIFESYSLLMPAICGLISLAVCLTARPMAVRLKLFDNPGGRKTHGKPTPLVGGVALLLGYYPWIAAWAFFNPEPVREMVLPVTACASVLTIVGLIDDRKHLSPTVRLFLCFLCIILTVQNSPSLVISQISWNYDAGYFSIPTGVGMLLSTFAVVTVIQGANLADGKNGLLIGLCLIWIYFIGSKLAPNFSIMLVSLVSLLLILLSFNLAGRLFLGDGGSYGLATFIALIAIYAGEKQSVQVTSDQFALIFLLPVIDMARLIVVRVTRGKSIFAGDRDHFHHHLLAEFGWPGGLAVYFMMVALPCFVATGAPHWTLTIIACTVIIYTLLIFGISTRIRSKA